MSLGLTSVSFVIEPGLTDIVEKIHEVGFDAIEIFLRQSLLGVDFGMIHPAPVLEIDRINVLVLENLRLNLDPPLVNLGLQLEARLMRLA